MRITLVHAGALGDTVVLLPLLGALRATFAGAVIGVVMRPAFGQLLKMWGAVEEWHPAEDLAGSRWFAEGAEATEWSDCDLLISAVSDGKDVWAENARRLSTAKEIRFFNPRPPEQYPGHVTAWQREQLADLGGGLVDGPAILPVLEVKNPDGAMVIHPGSGGEAKCWAREKYLALGKDLKRNGIVPTFILGEAEQERWGRELVEELQEEFPWYLHMGLYELAEKLQRARLYLGNDSGVSHLAGATGVRTLVIFGPSDDVQWRPIGPGVKVIRGEQDLARLEVSDVLAAVMREMGKEL